MNQLDRGSSAEKINIKVTATRALAIDEIASSLTRLLKTYFSAPRKSRIACLSQRRAALASRLRAAARAFSMALTTLLP
jgi:hypothetical protein